MADASPVAFAADRVWRNLPPGTRAGLVDALSPTDLQTVLLDVTRERARRVAPGRLAARWAEDRFVQPSPTDPRRLSRLEADLWDLVSDDFVGVELSPVAPLGACAAVGAADQNRIVSTIRGSEVVSDSTNVLALEAARRRRPGGPDVHLAACHRVLRAQSFGPGAMSHFRLLTLVSSGRDRGSRRTELDFLGRHLNAWDTVIRSTVGDAATMSLATFGNRELSSQLLTPLRQDFPRLNHDEDRKRGVHYYQGAALMLTARTEGGAIELGDGGLVDWTARLRSDAKERCLISCIATERLLELTG